MKESESPQKRTKKPFSNSLAKLDYFTPQISDVYTERCRFCLDKIVSPDDCDKKLCSYFNLSNEKLDKEELFYYLFNKRLNHIDTHTIKHFLNYHLKRTYNNEIKKFEQFLEEMQREYKKPIKSNVLKTLEEWKIDIKTTNSFNKIHKVVWQGHPLEVINGFSHLMTMNCKKLIPYCYIDNLEVFVYSNFEFPNFIIPQKKNQKSTYRFIWNGEKHDFTIMMRELKHHKKITSSYPTIAEFITRIMPQTKYSAIRSYLEGGKPKAKYAIDLNMFHI